ncbi:DUF1045 domain-containing protein [Sneathiella sp.]|jgi:putative phosphonate metabolism protein|uniref:DUF1045 domain-containing protein n=1 Tax=Sneathiella sp. TaxID=1964365 RepID=UPI0039E223C3
MNGYKRYAIYYAPKFDTPLSEFGNSWLGRDPFTGLMIPRPQIPELSFQQIQDLTRAPTHYGFHGTLKPPFFVKPDVDQRHLEEALMGLAEQLSAVEVGPLTLKIIGDFMALCPTGDLTALNVLAASCVKELDNFRLPLSQEELEYRRRKTLSDRQEENLLSWGYPYILDDFRFHLTLTDILDESEKEPLVEILERETEDLRRPPFILDQLCLFGDPGNGSPFRLIRRFSLS